MSIRPRGGLLPLEDMWTWGCALLALHYCSEDSGAWRCCSGAKFVACSGMQIRGRCFRRSYVDIEGGCIANATAHGGARVCATFCEKGSFG